SRCVDGDRSHLSAIEKRINLENRIFQAAYGAACNDPRPDRVGEYARLAMETLFDGDKVPENLLLQDCGRRRFALGFPHREIQSALRQSSAEIYRDARSG